MKTAQNAIVLARRHLGGRMESSARVCLADAVSLFDQGKFDQAHARALKSISYSVGICSAAYAAAAAI